MKSLEFLQEVWGPQSKQEVYFCLSTKKGTKWKDHFFKHPFEDRVKKFLRKHDSKQYNIYFCPTALKKPRRVKGAVVKTNLLWADLDEVNPREIALRPQVAWQSSPGRYACLWYLNKKIKTSKTEDINQRLSYAIGADKGGWDLSQVLRLPGTHNLKYKKKPPVILLWAKTSQYRIEKFKHLPEVSVDSADHKNVFKELEHRIPLTLRAILLKPTAVKGNRSDVLYKLIMGLISSEFTDTEIFNLVRPTPWNKFIDQANPDSNLSKDIIRARKKYIAQHGSDGYQSLARSVGQIDEERVKFLWPNYFPRNKLTLIEGDPGLGKSIFTCMLAYSVAYGIPMPGQKKLKAGKVIIFSAEDGAGDTIKPRLVDMGVPSDSDRILVIDCETDIDLDENIDIFESEVRLHRPTLIIIDPLMGFVGGGIDIFKANESRQILKRLSGLASRYKVTVAAIRHLTKGNRDKSIYRGQGSIDFAGAARSIILLGYDPEFANCRLIGHVKSNLSKPSPTVRYEIVEKKRKGKITLGFEWRGFTDISVHEIANTEPLSSQFGTDIDKAKKILKDLCPCVGKDIRSAMKKQNLEASAMKQARKELRVKVVAGKWTIP